MKPLVLPGGLLLLGATAFLQAGWLTLSAPGVTFLYYGVAIATLLMAWRFHSSRIFFATLVLFLMQRGLLVFSETGVSHAGSHSAVITAAGWLLPLNFVLISLTRERGFTTSTLAPTVLFLSVQSVFVAIFCYSHKADSALSARVAQRLVHTPPLPYFSVFAFAVAAAVLLARFLWSRKPVDGAMFWSLAACFLALWNGGIGRNSTAYVVTATFILGASIVETSYSLAYHDELTTLPSRRALNEELLRLQTPYSIAIVDIDHFKQFNDRHGHDVGDQVLRLVAMKLAAVTGGGKAYRCGGEEFAILFPGKTSIDALGHLEDLRAAVEASWLRLRTSDRRQVARGPDRRNQTPRSRARMGLNIRQLAKTKGPATLSVTVSIGVAAGTSEGTDPNHVIKAADKALYRAKDSGRNRVETASARRRAKAVGIA